MRTSEIIIIVLVTAALATGGVLAVSLDPPPSPCAGITGTTRSYTIVADSSGFNDSKFQPGPWPVVSVQRCDTVIFNVINNDTQTHGFGVESYSNAGLYLVGGDHQILKFQATRSGQFKIYCTVGFCTVHEFMLNGRLNVN